MGRTCITRALLWILAVGLVGCGSPEPAPSRAPGAVYSGPGAARSPALRRPAPSRPPPPSVFNMSSFTFIATEGTFRVYKLGTLIEQKKANEHRDGRVRFIVLGGGRGRIVGNMGTAPLTVHRTTTALVLIERTTGGSEHILTIYNVWEPRVKGFRAHYTRTVSLGGEVMRSEYLGYARP